MKCCFCGKEADSIEKAVESGSYPEFWRRSVSYQGPVCPDCQVEHLDTDADGEYVLKPDHPCRRRRNRSAKPRSGSTRPYWSCGRSSTLGRSSPRPRRCGILEESGHRQGFFLNQHVQGSWGEMNAEDKQANNQALVDGGRLLSAYRTLKGERVWIITEATDDDGKRAATTLLLPSQY